MNALKRFILVAALLTSTTRGAQAYGSESHAPESNSAAVDTPTPPAFTRLPEDVIETFKRIPIQDGGRVKPFDTVARFRLLRLYGKRTLTLELNGKPTRISATEWMIQSLLYPERVVNLPLFLVDNDEVVVAIGVEAHDKKRSRFSYNEILTGRKKLYELSQEYQHLEAQTRSAYQNGIVSLAQNVSEFEYLIHTLDFARERFSITPEMLPGVVEAATEWSVPDFLKALPEVRQSLFKQTSAEGGHESNPVIQEITKIVSRLSYYVGSGGTLHTMPAEEADVAEWLSPGAVIDESMRAETMSLRAYGHLSALDALIAAGDEHAALNTAAAHLGQEVRAQAQTRGELRHIDLEVHLYEARYFFWALFWYLVSFLIVACSWLLKPNPDASARARWIGLAIKLTPLLIATLYLVIGITLRCIIRGRPPVTNLYETVLFITAVAVLCAIIIEWLVRDRIAIALAPVLGTLGMFLAHKYEMKEAVDTMPSLVAVLNTNFWLSTHVTCITIGYAAGLLAGALGHVYILCKLFGIQRRNEDFHVSVTRMTYGVLCFGLLFSFVGTMLGGVWANYSWGRFWGWDPKENGALLIVLWQLVILHARMGGFIRDFGIAATAIFGAMIVTFSWWGVNLLGVGLHSYGFTTGIARVLITYWVFESVIILLGFVWRLRQGKASA